MQRKRVRNASASSRWLTGTAVVVAVLVVLSIAVTLTRGRDQAPRYDADTPEGAVERYLRAVFDLDYAAAYAYLAPAVRATCSEQAFREASRWFKQDAGSQRARIAGTRVVSGETLVDVRVTRTFGATPFGGEDTSTQVYSLKQIDGAWRLVQHGWPVFGCAEPRLAPSSEPAVKPGT